MPPPMWRMLRMANGPAILAGGLWKVRAPQVGCQQYFDENG
jgi:hypothetical protein